MPIGPSERHPESLTDVSLFAYDDMDWFDFVEPAASIVYQSVYEMDIKAESAPQSRLNELIENLKRLLYGLNSRSDDQ